MKRFYLLVFFLIFGLANVNSQSLPIEFEESGDAFTPFLGASFSFDLDPSDPLNGVGKFVNNPGDPFQGFFLDLAEAVTFDSNKEVGLDFFAMDGDAHQVLLKFENGLNPDVEVSVAAAALGIPGWQRLQFDFAEAVLSGDGSPMSASGSYYRITIFVDIGEGSGGVYFVDNVSKEGQIANPGATVSNCTELVWSDEFEGNGTIDTDKWHHQTQLPNGFSWFNGELQHYTDRVENAYLAGGALHIKAIKENFTDQGQTKAYTSARLNSKFAFTYGRVEVRAKLPQGAGTWPAIWMLGQNISEPGGYWYDEFGEVAWPACGEIDIMEHWGINPNYVSSAIHTPSSFGATENVGGTTLENVFDDFHTYEMEWTPEKIIFSVDGNAFYTYQPSEQNAETWPFNAPQYLLLNVAINGDITPAFSSGEMVIDYVRVYQEPTAGQEYYLITQFLPMGVLLIWNPPADAISCEVHSGPVGGNDPFVATIDNDDPHYLFVAPAVYSPPATYQWRVRCTCEDGSITPFSDYKTFYYAPFSE